MEKRNMKREKEKDSWFVYMRKKTPYVAELLTELQNLSYFDMKVTPVL